MPKGQGRIIFATVGTVLRRLFNDADLVGVSHVIVDEVHERDINTDFLLIVLKKLLARRPELRVIIVSATLNAHFFFADYFKVRADSWRSNVADSRRVRETGEELEVAR